MTPLTDERRQELQDMITQMKGASRLFYGMATRIGNHAFIEFTGLHNEYIKLCEQTLEQDRDFTECNIHSGHRLLVHDFNLTYFNEKLDCILGTVVDVKLTPIKKSGPRHRHGR